MSDVWTWIEKKAFTPREKDRESWLRNFHYFLPTVWGIQRDWNLPKKKDDWWSSDEIKSGSPLNIENLLLKPLRDADVGFSYSIHMSMKKFRILICCTEGLFRFDYALSDDNPQSKKIDIEHITQIDIEKSFERNIAHTDVHIHLQKINGEDFYNNIRFSSMSSNPFVVLYQIAYQLIDYTSYNSKMRNDEKQRIAKLIFDNRAELQINSRDLFSVKR
jgi:hypothetical protein